MRDVVFPWIKMVVENGRNCLFWTTNWSPFGRLSVYLGGDGAQSSGFASGGSISQYWSNGQWWLPHARSEAQVNLQIFLTTLQLSDNNEDRYEWRINEVLRNCYSIAEIYQILKDHGPKVSWSNEIQNSAGIPRHQFLAWLFVLDRCPTKDRLISWDIQTNHVCVLCNSGVESKNHLFFACSYSWSLWLEVGRCCGVSSLYQLDQTLQFLNQLPVKSTKRRLLLLGGQASIYSLQSERNHRIHRNSFKQVHTLLKNIDGLIRNRASSLRSDRP